MKLIPKIFSALELGQWFHDPTNLSLDKPFMKIDRIEDKWGNIWNVVDLNGVLEYFDECYVVDVEDYSGF